MPTAVYAKPMKGLLTFLSIALAAYGTFVALVYLMQPRLLYLPNIAGRSLVATPEAIGLAFETIRLTTRDDVSLHGWFVPAPQGERVLLFCHGNAGNISHRLDSIRIFHELDLAVLIFDYRGYGLSEGHPTEQGTYEDVRTAWRWLIEERGYRPDEIVLFGRSMGAAIAAELARTVDPAALIVESAFTSVPDLAAKYYWYLPVRWLARFSYATADAVREVDAPVLVVHSVDDEIVPFEHGRAIFEAARPPRTLLELEGDHNTGFLLSGARYLARLREFLESLDT